MGSQSRTTFKGIIMLWQNDEYAFADEFLGMLKEAYEDQPYLNKKYDDEDFENDYEENEYD